MKLYYQSCLIKENTFFYEKRKFTKNNTFNNIYCDRFFSCNTSYHFLEIIGFSSNMAYFSAENILYNSTVFNFENNFKILKHIIVIQKEIYQLFEPLKTLPSK